jgi:DNA polymerase
MAATIYQKKVEDVTKEERELGKRGILGCGYGMGHVKFEETCRVQAKLELPEGLAERAVTAYRTKYRTVVLLWQGMEAAAKEAIETKKPVKCGKVVWGVADGFLFCRLPAGRCLAYYDPKIEMVKTSWGEMKPTITHMGMNSVTRQWERQSTYGGKLAENVTQAVARDVMANAMLNCEAEGFKINLTVHDELLTEVDLCGVDFEAHALERPMIAAFEKVMTTLPAWAEGLPVKAEGWVGRRYSK